MLKKLQAIINIGASNLPEKSARSVRIVNIMVLITIVVTLTYLMYYMSIGEAVPVLINLTVVVLYGVPFFLNHIEKREFAKVWLLSVFTIHLFILTKFIFTASTGFHYYYMAFPPLSFLIYDYHQVRSKMVACLIPIVMFFICEGVDFSEPFIVLSEFSSRLLHLSSVVFMISGLFIIIYQFAIYIKQNEEELEETIVKLEKAMSEIKVLEGFIPICSSCKKIRDEEGNWNPVESHIQSRSNATFSHGTCPECTETLYGKEDWYREMKKKKLQD